MFTVWPNHNKNTLQTRTVKPSVKTTKVEKQPTSDCGLPRGWSSIRPERWASGVQQLRAAAASTRMQSKQQSKQSCIWKSLVIPKFSFILPVTWRTEFPLKVAVRNQQCLKTFWIAPTMRAKPAGAKLLKQQLGSVRWRRQCLTSCREPTKKHRLRSEDGHRIQFMQRPHSAPRTRWPGPALPWGRLGRKSAFKEHGTVRWGTHGNTSGSLRKGTHEHLVCCTAYSKTHSQKE